MSRLFPFFFCGRSTSHALRDALSALPRDILAFFPPNSRVGELLFRGMFISFFGPIHDKRAFLSLFFFPPQHPSSSSRLSGTSCIFFLSYIRQLRQKEGVLFLFWPLGSDAHGEGVSSLTNIMEELHTPPFSLSLG